MEDPQYSAERIEETMKWRNHKLGMVVRGEAPAVIIASFEDLEETGISLADLPKFVADNGLIMAAAPYDPTQPENCKIAISENRTAGDLLKTLKIPVFADYKSDLNYLRSQIDGLDIAVAIRYLSTYQIDGARQILIGLLLGYKPCCVSYYFKTRFLGQEAYPELERLVLSEDRPDNHIQCPCCVEERISPKTTVYHFINKLRRALVEFI